MNRESYILKGLAYPNNRDKQLYGASVDRVSFNQRFFTIEEVSRALVLISKERVIDKFTIENEAKNINEGVRLQSASDFYCIGCKHYKMCPSTMECGCELYDIPIGNDFRRPVTCLLDEKKEL